MPPPALDQRPGAHAPSPGLSAGQLGMVIVFASLTMLFGATVIAYLVTRAQNGGWAGDDLPPLPSGLWLSTGLLLGLSGSLEYGLRCIRRNRHDGLQRGLTLALAFAIFFLASQVVNWQAMITTQLPADTKVLYAFTFYMLTGTHAAHVVVGFIPLGIVLVRAYRRSYSSNHLNGVRFCVQYWHYLGLVWLGLLGAMHLAV